jgi:hypothetical protein
MGTDPYRDELLALLAEHQNFWARRAAVAQKLTSSMGRLEATLRRLHIRHPKRRVEPRDYFGFL